MKPIRQKRWGLKWLAKSRLDGRTEHLIWKDGEPLVFKTRREARNHAANRFGYIKDRPDLHAEPHGWTFPQVVRVEITIRLSLT